MTVASLRKGCDFLNMCEPSTMQMLLTSLCTRYKVPTKSRVNIIELQSV